MAASFSVALTAGAMEIQPPNKRIRTDGTIDVTFGFPCAGPRTYPYSIDAFNSWTTITARAVGFTRPKPALWAINGLTVLGDPAGGAFLPDEFLTVFSASTFDLDPQQPGRLIPLGANHVMLGGGYVYTHQYPRPVPEAGTWNQDGPDHTTGVEVTFWNPALDLDTFRPTNGPTYASVIVHLACTATEWDDSTAVTEHAVITFPGKSIVYDPRYYLDKATCRDRTAEVIGRHFKRNPLLRILPDPPPDLQHVAAILQSLTHTVRDLEESGDHEAAVELQRVIESRLHMPATLFGPTQG